MTEKLRVAVLLSGGGTTFQYIQDRIDAGEIPARVVVVVSSRADAGGLKRAEKHGIPCVVVERARFAGEADAEGAMSREMLAALERYPADLVVLAGFMTRISPEFVQRYAGRIMNTHPALIPCFSGKNFYGDRVHAAALESGVKVSGCTIHFVDGEYDHGPIILQKAVPVLDDDTVQSLGDRVRAEEKGLYCEAIRLFAEGRLRIEGCRTRVL